MKRFTFFFVFAVALYLCGGLAYAQHGHGAGGAVGGAVAHGESGSHGNAGDSAAEKSSGTTPKTASSQLMNNKSLDEALTKALGNLVPSGGLATACAGYTNLGRCISAIHVANNRKIDFFCIRKAMTGTALPSTTIDPAASSCTVMQTNLKLGQAIQKLDPNADSKVEATKATKQANTDIDNASHTQT
jgi:hypothetical protein